MGELTMLSKWEAIAWLTGGIIFVALAAIGFLSTLYFLFWADKD